MTGPRYKPTIYMMYSTEGSEFYIGSTLRRLRQRFYEHKTAIQTGRGATKCYEYFRQFPSDTIDIAVIAEYDWVHQHAIRNLEYQWINILEPTLNTIKFPCATVES